MVRLSRLALMAILVVCAAASFGTGRLLRDLLLNNEHSVRLARPGFLRNPLDLLQTKEPEKKKLIVCENYTHESFDESVRSYDHNEREVNPRTDLLSVEEAAGHHLLIDIEHVDSTFLDSVERLVQAMTELVERTGEHVSLLSYRCYGIEPMGVSCVGRLAPKSAVAFHTWPTEGVIMLDIYVTGSTWLLPLLDAVQSLFGVSTTDSDTLPRMVWAHKWRGFRSKEDSYDPKDEKDDDGDDDYYLKWMLGTMHEEKERVATVQTPFQTIDIFDFKTTRFEHKNRLVFLDGSLQSQRFGEAAYHESLVHPALFTHENPRRVVIVGVGGTLREVLKHKTVEEVIVLEVDQVVADVAREYLPEWSDCSSLEGSADSCFEDPRVTVYFEDAIHWFIDRFGDNASVAEEDLIDVIIMDIL